MLAGPASSSRGRSGRAAGRRPSTDSTASSPSSASAPSRSTASRSCSTRRCTSPPLGARRPGARRPTGRSRPARRARRRADGARLRLVRAAQAHRRHELAAAALGDVRRLRRAPPSTASRPGPTAARPGRSRSTSAPSAPSRPRPPGARSCLAPDPVARRHTMTYRIEIDHSLCSGFGACAELAPDVFEVGPERHRLDPCRRRATTRPCSKRPTRARWARSPSSWRSRRHRCPASSSSAPAWPDPGVPNGCASSGYSGRIRLVGEEPRRPLPKAGAFEGAAGGDGRPRRPQAARRRLVGGGRDRAHARPSRRADRRRRQEGATSRGRGAPLGGPRHRDGLACAGDSPRVPPVRGVHTLRSLQDALALRRELQAGRRLVVVGAGFRGDRSGVDGARDRRRRHVGRSHSPALARARRRGRCASRRPLSRPRDRPAADGPRRSRGRTRGGSPRPAERRGDRAVRRAPPGRGGRAGGAAGPRRKGRWHPDGRARPHGNTRRL